MALDTLIGWTSGDDLRVLTAAGVPVGTYQIKEVQLSMNHLGAEISGFVDGVLGLLDSYDAIQVALSTLNNQSGGKTLVKADVLEWLPAAPGSTYGPELEMARIRSLLAQYFSSCPIFSGTATMGTPLLRS